MPPSDPPAFPCPDTSRPKYPPPTHRERPDPKRPRPKPLEDGLQFRWFTPLQAGLDALARKREALTPDDRAKVTLALFHEGSRRSPFLNRFALLMTLSVLIAVLGLLADSTAVVIGAMLVAPLMSPVLGLAAALVMDWPRRALHSAATVAAGSGLAVLLAAFISFAVPGDPELLSSELLARTSPTALDLAVALVAGAAGAYATVRRPAADAIVGVAVAVALVPPLAVAGITLELGNYQMAVGSFLLFAANVSGIITSAAVTFILTGLVSPIRMKSTAAHVARSLRLATFATIVILAPLLILDEWRPDPTIDSDPEALVASAVAAWRTDVTIIAMDLTMPDRLPMTEPEDETTEDQDPDADERKPLIHLTVTSESATDLGPLGVETLAETLASIVGSPVDVVLTNVDSYIEKSEDVEPTDPATTLRRNRSQPS